MRDAEQPRDSAAGWVAMVLAVVVIANVLSLIVFFVVGGPFGFINDAGNGLIGVLGALLAILLRQHAGGWVGVVAAIGGAAVVAWGSWLVMTGTTGFLLAGFVSTIGFGLIGVWLGVLTWSPMADGWPIGLRRLGRIAAVAMVAGGLAAVPGALMGIDDVDVAPAWVWLFSIGWLGTYVLLPAASLRLGRTITARRRQIRS